MARSDLKNPGRLWRLPAVLAAVALLALPAWPFLHRFASGTAARGALALTLALGACSMLLGLGLGLWIALRLRTPLAVAAAAGATLVALLWWWVVFAPLVAGGPG